MGKNFFRNVGENIEDFLRRLCGEITPDKRVIVIVTMFILFGGLSIYMTISSIYNFGKDKGRRLEIERIESLKLQPEIQRDSINYLNEFDYGREDE
ncbi:MAG: TraL conjugative transposon family protein [Bacteroides sp.]|nr:TraL conjugative transposon family protein [Bacteroides sp.]